jgi:hypothetical protein
MMKFLMTTADGLVNVDQIVHIEPADKPGLSRALLLDGSRVHIVGALDEIRERQLLPIIPASPGYTKLTYYDQYNEDGSPGVERMPVVAWQIDESYALPVTPDDPTIPANCIGSGVLMPDGQVVQPYEATYQDEAAWRAAMDRRAKASKPKAVNEPA